jgi:hypothetical protein
MHSFTLPRMAKYSACQAFPSAKFVAADVAAGDGKTYEQTKQVYILKIPRSLAFLDAVL